MRPLHTRPARPDFRRQGGRRDPRQREGGEGARPEAIAAADAEKTEVVANVFGASERSRVEMRVDVGGGWVPMTRVLREDPQFLRLKELEAGPNPPSGRKLPAPKRDVRLWRAVLPKGLTPGVRKIEVRTTDMFGQTYTGERVITLR